jgi:hypothetical protein
MITSLIVLGTTVPALKEPSRTPSFVSLLVSSQASRWLGAKTFGGRVTIESGGTYSAFEVEDGGLRNEKMISGRDTVLFTLNLNQKSVSGQVLTFRGEAELKWEVEFSRRDVKTGPGGFTNTYEFGKHRTVKTLSRLATLTLDIARGTYALSIEAQERLMVPHNVTTSTYIPGDRLNTRVTGTPNPPPVFTRVLNSVTIRNQGADLLEWGPSYPLAADATLDAAAMGMPSLDGRPFTLPAQGNTIRGKRTLPLRLQLFDQVFSPNLTKTWTLTADPKPMQLEVEIPGHKEWMPTAGGPSGEEGNSLKLTATVLNADGTKSQVTPEKIEFRLINTSREPGAAINSPVENPRLDPDLQFSPAQNPTGVMADQGQAITFDSATAGPSTTAVLSSYDFGGFTTVEVKATLPGGQELTGQLKTGEPEILVPHRTPGSRIATGFAAPGGDLDDTERQEGNPFEGDGLTQYEEYRGLFAKGAHRRLDGKTKEIIVNDRTGQFSDSIALFESASGLDVIEVNQGELSERRLNFNSEEGQAIEQYGLIIQWGERMPNPTVLGVTVFRNGAEESNRWLANVLRIDMRRNPPDDPGMVTDTAAHEMAHACGAEHHGEPFEGPSPFVLRPIDRLLNADGSRYANNPTELKSTIDIPGGLSSGDAECLMAYPKGSFVARPNAEGGWNFTRALEPQVRRTRLCRSKAATGYNTLPHSCGDASAGNCFGMIRLRP